MEKQPVTIPQRLFFIRATVTLALVISFLLSLNLWGGGNTFPSIPLINHLVLSPSISYLLVFFSIVCLICSLFLKKQRLFIFLSLFINAALVVFDLNRLQPWFYIYNAILLVLLFYNGRVDEPGRFTCTFIIIQLIIASVYMYNGINQLNSYFLQTDFYNTIAPLNGLANERQFSFFLSAGRFVPYFIMFIGLGLIIKPLRYISLPAAWLFHLILLILLFPTAKNTNYALWFMNLVFGLLVLFLFSGKTSQRYFNRTLLFQKPLFYLIVFTFWVVPALNYINYWPKSPTANFRYGQSQLQNLIITKNTYNQMPLYLRHFCFKNNDNFTLKVSEWCRHELGAEYTSHAAFNTFLVEDAIQITSRDVKEREEELSSL